MAEEIINCSSTTTGGKGKYEVIKAYLNMHHIEYDENHNNAGCHFWTSIKYQLTRTEFTELLLYLKAAELRNDVII